MKRLYFALLDRWYEWHTAKDGRFANGLARKSGLKRAMISEEKSRYYVMGLLFWFVGQESRTSWVIARARELRTKESEFEYFFYSLGWFVDFDKEVRERALRAWDFRGVPENLILFWFCRSVEDVRLIVLNMPFPDRFHFLEELFRVSINRGMIKYVVGDVEEITTDMSLLAMALEFVSTGEEIQRIYDGTRGWLNWNKVLEKKSAHPLVERKDALLVSCREKCDSLGWVLVDGNQSPYKIGTMPGI